MLVAYLYGSHVRGRAGPLSEVDPVRIWTHLGRLDDLADFAHAVDAYLQQAS